MSGIFKQYQGFLGKSFGRHSKLVGGEYKRSGRKRHKNSTRGTTGESSGKKSWLTGKVGGKRSFQGSKQYTGKNIGRGPDTVLGPGGG